MTTKKKKASYQVGCAIAACGIALSVATIMPQANAQSNHQPQESNDLSVLDSMREFSLTFAGDNGEEKEPLTKYEQRLDEKSLRFKDVTFDLKQGIEKKTHTFIRDKNTKSYRGVMKDEKLKETLGNDYEAYLRYQHSPINPKNGCKELDYAPYPGYAEIKRSELPENWEDIRVGWYDDGDKSDPDRTIKITGYDYECPRIKGGVEANNIDTYFQSSTDSNSDFYIYKDNTTTPAFVQKVKNQRELTKLTPLVKTEVKFDVDTGCRSYGGNTKYELTHDIDKVKDSDYKTVKRQDGKEFKYLPIYLAYDATGYQRKNDLYPGYEFNTFVREDRSYSGVVGHEDLKTLGLSYQDIFDAAGKGKGRDDATYVGPSARTEKGDEWTNHYIEGIDEKLEANVNDFLKDTKKKERQSVDSDIFHMQAWYMTKCGEVEQPKTSEANPSEKAEGTQKPSKEKNTEDQKPSSQVNPNNQDSKDIPSSSSTTSKPSEDNKPVETTKNSVTPEPTAKDNTSKPLPPTLDDKSEEKGDNSEKDNHSQQTKEEELPKTTQIPEPSVEESKSPKPTQNQGLQASPSTVFVTTKRTATKKPDAPVVETVTSTARGSAHKEPVVKREVTYETSIERYQEKDVVHQVQSTVQEIAQYPVAQPYPVAVGSAGPAVHTGGEVESPSFWGKVKHLLGF